MSGKKGLFDNLDQKIADQTNFLMSSSGKGDSTAQKEALKSAIALPVGQLVCFKNHPFRVEEEGDEFDQLVDSIRSNGILYPILVRPLEKDKYEIISGHRRVAASKMAGLDKVPVLVRPLNDDEATIAMVHSNMYREKIRVSEKARAYRMYVDAEKHQGTKGEDTAKKAGDQMDSKRQVYRYVRVSYLTDELLQMVDDGVFAFNAAYEIAFLDSKSMAFVQKYVQEMERVPSLEQALNIKKLFEEKKKEKKSLSYDDVCSLMADNKPEKKPAVKVTLNEKKLYDYFDLETSVDEMQEVIIALLDGYKNGTITLQNGSYSDKK